jgi:hypothetical protein
MQKKKFQNIVDTADVIKDFLPICAGAKVFTIAKIALGLQRLLLIQPIFSQIDILIFDRLCEKVHTNQKTFSIFGSLSLWDLMTDT